uniref:Uncharacterized protein n=1 Tax=Lotus japonicus TaxID=34305 RepID=I3ST08_LOTJA|nr:unknown [Lotus japonicus]
MSVRTSKTKMKKWGSKVTLVALLYSLLQSYHYRHPIVRLFKYTKTMSKSF